MAKDIGPASNQWVSSGVGGISMNLWCWPVMTSPSCSPLRQFSSAQRPQAAIDEDGLGGDVSRIVSDEEADQGADVGANIADPPERDLFHGRLERLRLVPLPFDRALGVAEGADHI